MGRINRSFLLASATVVGALLGSGASRAQLTDTTQTPNAANSGIHKSYAQEIGAGRGDVNTPDSSIFIIQRDPFRAIRRGRQLFQRKFQVSQGFGPRTNDGVGNIAQDASVGAGLVDSCAGCHSRPRGSAGAGGNVATRPDSRDTPHLFGLGLQEMLADEITHDLRVIRAAAVAEATAEHRAVELALIAKGISYGAIRANADGSLDTSGVVGVNPDLRVRPFFAHGGTVSIREFAVGALNAEMGLEAPDPDLLSASSGGVVTTPSGMVLDGTMDAVEAPPVASPTQDGDGDGVVNEVPTSVVDFLEYYLLHYFKPATGRQTLETTIGRIIFSEIGCTNCHKPNLMIEHDRRVADVETDYDAEQGNPFNHLFATATPTLIALPDGSGFPAIKRPAGQAFLVRNIFSDFKRHDLGNNFHEVQYDNTLNSLFMTEALWGVATTAPYGHDGRSQNLEEVILRHGGEAQSSRDRFDKLAEPLKQFLLAFMGTLQLFPPDDTASNLQPAAPANPDFPQRGHGAIALTVLFNNPADLE
jgi:hypothetical protein